MSAIDPLGRVKVEERRLEPLDQVLPHVEEAGAARAAEELAPGRREDVAAELAHVGRQLPDRLARVEQQRHSGRPTQAPHLGGRLHQATLRGHVDERDEPGAARELRLERRQRDLAALVVADHDDDGACALRHLEEGDVVRRVLGAAGEDPVARLEVEGVEGHVPRPRRVLDDRDLVARAAEQARDGVVDRLDPASSRAAAS